MKERPILFSAPMVRAILEDTKTQTRRIVKPQPPAGTLSVSTWHHPDEDEKGPHFWPFGEDEILPGWSIPCPYARKMGDQLWVRETWRPFYTDSAIYLADAGTHRLNAPTEAAAKASWPGWKPSIHMPRRHSRISLEVTTVRVEKLVSISVYDAVNEGWSKACPDTPGVWYSKLWEEINGPGSWAANPWVWVIEFKKVT